MVFSRTRRVFGRLRNMFQSSKLKVKSSKCLMASFSASRERIKTGATHYFSAMGRPFSLRSKFWQNRLSACFLNKGNIVLKKCDSMRMTTTGTSKKFQALCFTLKPVTHGMPAGGHATHGRSTGGLWARRQTGSPYVDRLIRNRSINYRLPYYLYLAGSP